MTFDLTNLGEAVVDVVGDEASFLAMYESNWAGVFGLPGRRESHIVAALSAHLRHKYQTRCVLDDSLWGCPDTRCDLSVQLSTANADQWAWIEVKTMPIEDANDKLASIHDDLTKLDDAIVVDRRNLPQALIVIGYDREGGTLEPRLNRFARDHGLDLWPNSANGVRVIDLPASPSPQRYKHAVVGVWTRADEHAKALQCDRRCHLVRR